MESLTERERELFELAFETAYFIHVNKEVAFFIAEDALDALSASLGYQKKNRPAQNRLRGFLKWGERTRPIRRTLMFNERQMLQWLVYRESAHWERRTERGEGPYLPTEEDLIVRYIEHLVFSTIRRNSFYVTLGIGSLLHQFDRRETRLFYDILTQSDSARMKDTHYIGKQRLELLDRVSQRFDGMIRLEKKTGEEKQFQMKPTSEWIIELVNESLRRFTPSQTSCALEPKFDITDIPDFYFAETNDNDEDSTEMTRIHTVIDPACFDRFCSGLASYVRTLPSADLDGGCRFDSLNERLVIPQFSNFQDGPRRSDRLQKQKLGAEDYIRLQRMLEARGHRKKSFVAHRVLIYVDGVLSSSFEPQKQRFAQCMIEADSSFVEVRGRDADGEVTLATLMLDNNAPHRKFEDSIIHPGGQTVSMAIEPLTLPDHRSGPFRLRVTYSQIVPSVIERAYSTGVKLLTAVGGENEVNQRGTWLVKVTIGVMILMSTSFLLWRFLLRQPAKLPERQVELRNPEPLPSTAAGNSSPTPRESSSPAPPERRLSPRDTTVAQASWNMDAGAALSAVPIELTRSGKQGFKLSSEQNNVTLSLPIYDEAGQLFSHYQITLTEAGMPKWKKTLQAPKSSVTSYTHLLDVVLLKNRLPNAHESRIHISARAHKSWRTLGTVTFTRLPARVVSTPHDSGTRKLVP